MHFRLLFWSCAISTLTVDPKALDNTAHINGAAQSSAAQFAASDQTTEDIADPQKSSSFVVIEKNMLFWDERGEDLLKKLLKFLDTHENKFGISAADKVARVTQALADAKQKAVDAAAKLIPFQAPKLSNIELKSKQVHRFVVQAPTPAPNAHAWLSQVNQEAKMLPSAQQIIAKNKEEVEQHQAYQAALLRPPVNSQRSSLALAAPVSDEFDYVERFHSSVEE